jgi:hypothetical protein
LIFRGSFEQLQALVGSLEIPCEWIHKGPFQMAVFHDGESNLRLNWWPETGEVSLVGDPAQRIALQERVQLLLERHDAGKG